MKVRHRMRVKTQMIAAAESFRGRPARLEDVPALAVLMDRSFRGTVDHEGETLEQCMEEMRGTLLGKYGLFLDFASFVIEENGEILSTSLLTLWKGQPLLVFSMTDPKAQGQGLAQHLIGRSISALAERGYPELFLTVTEGNASAQRLYVRLGFAISSLEHCP